MPAVAGLSPVGRELRSAPGTRLSESGVEGLPGGERRRRPAWILPDSKSGGLRWACGLIAMAALAPWPLAAAVSRIPANGAAGINPDTHLSLTFDGAPTLGTSGQIRIYEAGSSTLVDMLDLAIPPSPPRAAPAAAGTPAPAPAPSQLNTIGGLAGFHFYPLIITGNTAVITPHNNVLAYGKTYRVQIDAGVLLEGANPFPGFAGTRDWVFTIKVAPPAPGATRHEVAADGSGDFNTEQGAVDSIPDQNPARTTVFIRTGVYQEIVYFRNKTNITFLGEDREGVVVGYANNENFNAQPGVPVSERVGSSPYRRASFHADHSSGIQLVNLTLKNFTPRGGSQAEALLLNGGQNLVSHVNLVSLQDTLQFNDSVYIADSYIEGEVDFMWGRGPAFFKDCILNQLGRGPFMWIRSTSASHGFVFLHNTFQTAAGQAPLLARNTAAFPYSEVVLLDSAMGAINPAAWMLAGDLSNQHYWEFGTTNLADGRPADVSGRLAGSRQLDRDKDAETIANYRNPAYVLGGWTPRLAPLIIEQPGAQTVTIGQNVTMTATVAAVPAPAYQWRRNGVALQDGAGISGATTPTLVLSNARAVQAGTYTVVATNDSGSATSNAAGLTVR